MSIKKPYQAINDVLTSPATMTIVVSIVMLLTAAVGVIGSTKDKLMLLRVVGCVTLRNPFVAVFLNRNIIKTAIFNKVIRPIMG